VTCNMLLRIKNLSLKVLGGLLIIFFTALVLDVVLGVFMRYALSSPLGWTEELATFLMVWLVFLGSAYAYLSNSHLGIDLLERQLDPGARRLMNGFTHLMVLACSLGIFIYGGGMLFLERWDSGQLMPTLGIKKAWFYLSVPVSGVLMCVFAVEKLVDYQEGEES
jgi:TRAP-type C4-dicarboxylate transport system permease small subunit